MDLLWNEGSTERAEHRSREYYKIPNHHDGDGFTWRYFYQINFFTFDSKQA